MNDFDLMAEGYRASGDEKRAGHYEYLAKCGVTDLCMLFDSGAFNRIAKAYLRQTVNELTAENKITEDQARALQSRFTFLFDERRAGEIIKTP